LVVLIQKVSGILLDDFEDLLLCLLLIGFDGSQVLLNVPPILQTGVDLQYGIDNSLFLGFLKLVEDLVGSLSIRQRVNEQMFRLNFCLVLNRYVRSIFCGLIIEGRYSRN
jgi:hypothetical protein